LSDIEFLIDENVLGLNRYLKTFDIKHRSVGDPDCPELGSDDDEFGTFDKYIWSFVSGKTIVKRYKHWKDIPAFSNESKEMGRDLKKRGFTFVGPTICYAFMQSAGLLNDHIVNCFRHSQVLKQEN